MKNLNIKKFVKVFTNKPDFEYVENNLPKIISDYKKVKVVVDNIKLHTPLKYQKAVLNYILNKLYQKFDDKQNIFSFNVLSSELPNPGLSWPLYQSTIILLKSGASHRKALSHINFKKFTIETLNTQPQLIENIGLLSYALKNLESEIQTQTHTHQKKIKSDFVESVLNEFTLDELKKIIKVCPETVTYYLEYSIAQKEATKMKSQLTKLENPDLKIKAIL